MQYGISRKEKPQPEKLSTLKHGDIFRFQDTSFEEAMAQKDDATFFMVINLPKTEADRVGVTSLDGKTVLVRDGSHFVYKESDCTLSFHRMQ